MKRRAINVILLGLLCLEPVGVSANAPDRLELAVGAFTSFQFAAAGAAKLEYKSGFNLIHGEASVNPALGCLVNTDSGSYVYGGLKLVFQFSGPWNFENFAGIGGYWRENGPDLYQTLEFSLAGTITRKLADDYRVGFEFFHISNAGMQVSNPGANSYFLVVQREF